MGTLLKFALEYEKLGWFVLPADPIEKKPMVKWKDRRDKRPTPEEIRGWWKKFPLARIAIAAGVCSGFDAVDVDGPDALEKLFAICGGIPETIYQTTGREEGGRHLLFKHNRHELRPYQDGVLDLRTSGSMIIVAPSKHKSGRTYSWGKINPIEHGLNDLAVWPPELVQYFRSVSGSDRKKEGRSKQVTVGPVPPGERHQALASLIGKWINNGLDDETIMLAARGWWEKLPYKEGFSMEELEEQTQDLVTRYRKPQSPPNGCGSEKKKQTDVLVRIGKTAKVFQAPDGTLWARFQTKEHFECWPIRSKATGFRRWLVSEYFKETGSAPSTRAVQDAVGVLEGEAQYGVHRSTQDVFTRVGEYGGKKYIDMADERWRAIEISQDGWQVVKNPPVCFRRTRGMLPLPEPKPGGNLRLLDGLVNLGGEENRKLILSWLIYTLNPCGPYPLLGLFSEQGSGKSVTALILRLIIDPNRAPIRSLPKNLEDLAVAAQHSWILGFDNLSYIPEPFSDALCRMATGAGFATRALYSNDEEVVFWAKRPIVLNGISDFTSRPDLLERTLVVNLPAIPPEERQTENTILERFEKARPALLGALLDAVVITLRNLPKVTLTASPRMADFAQWVAAAAPAIGADRGEIVSLLFEKQNEALLSEIDSPLPQALFNLLDQRNGKVEMLLVDLLAELNKTAPEDATRQKSWPKTPRRLSGALARIIPVMRAAGIKIADLGRTNKGRRILIEGEGRVSVGDGRRPKVTVGDGQVPVDRHHLTIQKHSKGDGWGIKGDESDGRFPYNSSPLKNEKKGEWINIGDETVTNKCAETPSPPSHRHELDLFGGEL